MPSNRLSPKMSRTATGQGSRHSVSAIDNAAMMEIRVPANAEVWVEGDKTSQTGAVRHFVSPTLQTGKTFTYDIRARWTGADGKASFAEDAIAANVKAFIDAVIKAKPSGAKGNYMKKVSISSTMGPGVKISLASVGAGGPAA